MLTLILPWPSASLSPNGGVARWDQIRAKKAAKNYAWGMTKAAMGPLKIAPGSWVGPIMVQYTFHPRQYRNRDDDNFIAAMKAARDGMALALGINDVHFVTLPIIWGVKRTGEVEVTLTPATVLQLRGVVS